MTEKEVIQYLHTIKHGDWIIFVTSKWNVKDVVAHMIGWTEIDLASLDKIDELGNLTWRQSDFNVDDYNAQSVEKYSKISPKELLSMWEDSIDKRDKLIQVLGKEKISKDKDLLHYLLEDGNSKHNLHHCEQIKRAIPKS